MSPEQHDRLQTAGKYLSSTLAGALLGGAGAGSAAYKEDAPEESPEERRARIMRSIMIGGGLGAGAGALLPAGLDLTKQPEPTTAQKVVGAPLNLIRSHLPTAAGLGVSSLAAVGARDKIRRALLEAHVPQFSAGGKLRVGGGVEGTNTEVPSHLVSPPPGAEPEEALQKLQGLLFRGRETAYPESVQRAISRLAQGRSAVGGKDIVGAAIPEALHKLPGARNLPVSRTAVRRIVDAVKLLGSTKVPLRKNWPVSALALAGLAAAPAGLGAATEYSMS